MCVVHKRCHEFITTKCSGVKEEVGSDSGEQGSARFKINVPHRFVVHNYKRFTWCDHCGSLLYGLYRQGLKCEACEVNVHKRCQHNVANSCGINARQLADILNDMGMTPHKLTESSKPKKKPVSSSMTSSSASGSPASSAASSMMSGLGLGPSAALSAGPSASPGPGDNPEEAVSLLYTTC